MISMLDIINEIGTSTDSSVRQSISPSTPYGVVDSQTGVIVYRTTYKNRTKARNIADKKDNEYGAYRYQARALKPGE